MTKARDVYQDKNGYEPTPAELCTKPLKCLPGYNEITCHMVFDVKLDGNFTQKAHYVANELRVESPKSMA